MEARAATNIHNIQDSLQQQRELSSPNCQGAEVEKPLVYPLHPGLFRSIHPYTEFRLVLNSVVRRTFNCSYQNIFYFFSLRWPSSLHWWKGRYWLMFLLFAFSWSRTRLVQLAQFWDFQEHRKGFQELPRVLDMLSWCTKHWSNKGRQGQELPTTG